MQTDKPTIEEPPEEMVFVLGSPLGRRRHFLVAQGVAIASLGVLAIAWPAITAVDHDVFVGYVLIASGLTGPAALVAAENVPGFLWTMLTAALSLLSGVLLLWRPGGAPISLTQILTALFAAEGAFQSATSYSCRHVFTDAWGWMLLSGVADLVLASLIMLDWPDTAAQTLELFVGINLISSGWAAIMIASGKRPAQMR